MKYGNNVVIIAQHLKICGNNVVIIAQHLKICGNNVVIIAQHLKICGNNVVIVWSLYGNNMVFMLYYSNYMLFYDKKN